VRSIRGDRSDFRLAFEPALRVERDFALLPVIFLLFSVPTTTIPTVNPQGLGGGRGGPFHNRLVDDNSTLRDDLRGQSAGIEVISDWPSNPPDDRVELSRTSLT
jgi:hypothetical protein